MISFICPNRSANKIAQYIQDNESDEGNEGNCGIEGERCEGWKSKDVKPVLETYALHLAMQAMKAKKNTKGWWNFINKVLTKDVEAIIAEVVIVLR